MSLDVSVQGNASTAHSSRSEKTPLQILLHLGISERRAEKALAATGGSAKDAMNWLVSHIDDPKLDAHEDREYALYAVPTGEFGERLLNFWYDTRERFNWNEAHNRLPHITLVSFFRAPNDITPQLVDAVKKTVNQLNKYYKGRVDLGRIHDETLIGFYIGFADEILFKSIGRKYLEFVNQIKPREVNQSGLMACCPWSPRSESSSSYDIEARGSSTVSNTQLFITLARNFDYVDSEGLGAKFEQFENIDASSWELRLYSRQISIDAQVFRVKREYKSRCTDELDISVGDYISASTVNVNDGDQEGWILGTSHTTGASGYFPAKYADRVPESDSWILHTRVPFIGSADAQSQEPLKDLSKRDTDKELEECTRVAIESKTKLIPWNASIGENLRPPREGQKLMIMRHGERVDYSFPKWTDKCFTEMEGYKQLDLNLPQKLPERKDGHFRFPWSADPPLTNVGIQQALLTGQMLRSQGITIHFVYSSPAFRCIQTAQAVLDGLKAKSSVQIRVDPSLFEWCGHLTKIPEFLTVAELHAAGYRVDVGYVPHISLDELRSKYIREELSTFYKRCHQLTDYAIKRSEKDTLIVAHAANLETNSRELLNGTQLNLNGIRKIVKTVPYAGLLALENYCNEGKWSIAKPFVLPMSHSRNFQFDPQTILDTYPIEENDAKKVKNDL